MVIDILREREAEFTKAYLDMEWGEHLRHLLIPNEEELLNDPCPYKTGNICTQNCSKYDPNCNNLKELMEKSRKLMEKT